MNILETFTVTRYADLLEEKKKPGEKENCFLSNLVNEIHLFMVFAKVSHTFDMHQKFRKRRTKKMKAAEKCGNRIEKKKPVEQKYWPENDTDFIF